MKLFVVWFGALSLAGFVAARADPSVSDTSNELRAVTVIPDVSRGTPSAREVPLPRGVTELAGGFHGLLTRLAFRSPHSMQNSSNGGASSHGGRDHASAKRHSTSQSRNPLSQPSNEIGAQLLPLGSGKGLSVQNGRFVGGSITRYTVGESHSLYNQRHRLKLRESKIGGVELPNEGYAVSSAKAFAHPTRQAEAVKDSLRRISGTFKFLAAAVKNNQPSNIQETQSYPQSKTTSAPAQTQVEKHCQLLRWLMDSLTRKNKRYQSALMTVHFFERKRRNTIVKEGKPLQGDLLLRALGDRRVDILNSWLRALNELQLELLELVDGPEIPPIPADEQYQGWNATVAVEIVTEF